jgi:hypothetical protein
VLEAWTNKDRTRKTREAVLLIAREHASHPNFGSKATRLGRCGLRHCYRGDPLLLRDRGGVVRWRSGRVWGAASAHRMDHGVREEMRLVTEKFLGKCYGPTEGGVILTQHARGVVGSDHMLEEVRGRRLRNE